jgi:methyl-accepting chemotaxis protein
LTFALGIIFAILTLAAAAFAAFAGVELDTDLPISDSPIIYGWAAGMMALLVTAFVSRRSKNARFETVVASEVVVVYGITTLVLSIGLGVSRTADVWNAAAGPPPLDQLVPSMRVFAEGFVAAGVSPFCAVGLRQLDVLGRGDQEPVGEVSNELDSLKAALGTAAGATAGFAQSMRQASEVVDRASMRISTSLDGVAASGEGAKAGLDAASAAASNASGRVQPAAEELARLGAAASEGAVLLDGLRDIIASVEEFLPRGRNGGHS